MEGRSPPRGIFLTHTVDDYLRNALEEMERKWVTVLGDKFSEDHSWPPFASGYVQFFSTDGPMARSAALTEEAQRTDEAGTRDTLIVACIGMSSNAYSRNTERRAVPYIYARSGGASWLIDEKRSRAVRRALGASLAEYAISARTWVANGYASSATLLPGNWNSAAPHRLVVVRAFVSPFVQTRPWADQSRSAKTATLLAWNPNQHICDLITMIGGTVDVWVMHGTALWPHFIKDNAHVSKWLLTPTLSFESQRNRAIATFWKTPRHDEPLRMPSFPSC